VVLNLEVKLALKQLNLKVKVLKYSLMDQFMKASSNKVKLMEKEEALLQKVKYMREILNLI
jgi:hypothetical protein